jgi:ribonuclease HI
MENIVLLYTDGGSRGTIKNNAGRAAIGIVIYSESGDLLLETAATIGRATNNEAEYQALISGLSAALKFTTKKVIAYSDSQLMVNQVKGSWKLNDAKLQALFRKVISAEAEFDSVEYIHVPRETNEISRADRILNQALDLEKRNLQVSSRRIHTPNNS